MASGKKVYPFETKVAVAQRFLAGEPKTDLAIEFGLSFSPDRPEMGKDPARAGRRRSQTQTTRSEDGHGAVQRDRNSAARG